MASRVGLVRIGPELEEVEAEWEPESPLQEAVSTFVLTLRHRGQLATAAELAALLRSTSV